MIDSLAPSIAVMPTVPTQLAPMREPDPPPEEEEAQVPPEPEVEKEKDIENYMKI